MVVVLKTFPPTISFFFYKEDGVIIKNVGFELHIKKQQIGCRNKEIGKGLRIKLVSTHTNRLTKERTNCYWKEELKEKHPGKDGKSGRKEYEKKQRKEQQKWE